MKYSRIHGVVIAERKHGDSDKFVVLYSREFGRLHCFARGVKKIKSKFRSRFELLTCGLFDLARSPNRDYHIITGISSQRPFFNIRTDRRKMLAATLASEVMDKMTVPDDPDEKLFMLYYRFLRAVDAGRGAEDALCALFLLKFTQISGFGINTDSCPACGAVHEGGNAAARYDHASGGFLCPGCSGKAPGDLSAGPLLERLKELSEVRSLDDLALSRAGGLLTFLVRHLETRGECSMKSHDFVKNNFTIRKMERIRI